MRPTKDVLDDRATGGVAEIREIWRGCAAFAATPIRLFKCRSRDSGIPASRANTAADFPLAFHRVISFAISRRFASRLPTVTSGPLSFLRLGHGGKDGVRRTFTDQ